MMSGAGFIAVHTGAGNCVDERKYEKACRDACQKATAVLKAGGHVLDACEAAIVRLENSSNTNAGYGSNLTLDGTVECDASIMDGRSLHFGACTNVTDVANPISLANIICKQQSNRLNMGRIPPMILSGAGASKYGREHNLPLCSNHHLLTRKAVRYYKHYIAIMKSESAAAAEGAALHQPNGAALGAMPTISLAAGQNGGPVVVVPQVDAALDTVGAVCVDALGNCAAGCSSGGLLLKVNGRVGQAATYGAGCWAESFPKRSIATCTTGNGEYLMRTLLAREIVRDLEHAECSVTAMHGTFKHKFLQSRFLGGLDEVYGGAVSLTYDPGTGGGEVLWSHTTRALCLGFQSTSSKSPKYVFSSLPSNTMPGTTANVTGQHFRISL